MKAPFGWTVVARGGGRTNPAEDEIYVYKRDCPADAAHFAADLAPFTHDTKALAIAAGKRGEYAYKRVPVAPVLVTYPDIHVVIRNKPFSPLTNKIAQTLESAELIAEVRRAILAWTYAEA